jgi:hypothetical protein
LSGPIPSTHSTSLCGLFSRSWREIRIARGLMASLYQWLYAAASRVFVPFGFDEAKNVYAWRRECYAEARENGEDVDLEGEVEAADPAKVIGYIRNSHRLILKAKEVGAAIGSIAAPRLRAAFVSANRMFLESRRIKLPSMSEDSRRILDDAAYYMDAYPIPGLGIHTGKIQCSMRRNGLLLSCCSQSNSHCAATTRTEHSQIVQKRGNPDPPGSGSLSYPSCR